MLENAAECRETPKLELRTGGASLATREFSIELLGPLRILVRGEPLARMRSKKGLWLLAVLTLHANREVARRWLADILWPESDGERALFNLRENLHDLRRALGPLANRITSPQRASIRLVLNPAEADVLRFDALLASSEDDAVREAVFMYRGHLLEGCHEEWANSERDARALKWAEAVEGLAERDIATGHFRDATRILRPLARIETYRESAHRLLMQALAGSGNQAEATRIYRALALNLHRDLNTSPSKETVAMYESLSSLPARDLGPKAASGPDARRPLPVALTRFIGRDAEARELKRMMESHRLVTVVGSGGIGKTRLAVQVAAEFAKVAQDGVWFICLDGTEDPQLVPNVVALALGLPLSASRSALDSVVQHLREREGVILIDNCEHLIDEVHHLVQAITQNCPSVRMLATSRQRLGITGEQAYELPTMTLPDEEGGATDASDRADLLQFDAVQLFVERAREAKPDFQLSPDNVRTVVRVLHRLGGVALAIELTASKLRSLSVAEIHERLNDRFRLLADGSRTAMPRHQSLAALIEWSYRALDDREREMLTCLTVFEGGWTAEACVAVWIGTDPADAPVLLSALVEKSLVTAESTASGTRYAMLENIRHYILDLNEESELRQQTVVEQTRSRHLAWCVQISEAAYAADRTADEGNWRRRVETEIGNFRAALTWALGRDDASEAALRLAGNLGLWWFRLGRPSEGLDFLVRARDANPNSKDTTATLRALYAIGWLSHVLEDRHQARRSFEELAAGCPEHGDLRMRSKASFGLCILADEREDFVAAAAQSESSLALAEESGDLGAQASAFLNIAHAQCRLGLYDAARTNVAKAMALNGERGTVRGTANCLHVLAWSYHRQDRFDLATKHYELALTRSRDGDYVYGEMESLFESGEMAYARGEVDEGRTRLEQALNLCRQIGLEKWESIILSRLARATVGRSGTTQAEELLGKATPYFVRANDAENLAACFLGFVDLALAGGNPLAAAVRLGAAKNLRTSCSEVVHAHDLSVWDALGSRIKASNSPDFESAMRVGESASRAAIKDYALELAMLGTGALEESAPRSSP